MSDPSLTGSSTYSAQDLRFVGQWPCGLDATVGLDVTAAGKLILRDDPACSKIVPGNSFLFHCNGMTPVQVHDGDNLRFDGGKQGILNYNGTILFTHELLLEMLSSQEHGRNSFKGMWEARVQTWHCSLANAILQRGLCKQFHFPTILQSIPSSLFYLCK